MNNPVAEATLRRLPAGAIDVGRKSLSRGLELFGCAGGAQGRGDLAATEADVAAHLVRPLLLVDDWPDPTPPLPVADGAIHADLTDEDHESLALLRSTLAADDGPPVDAERLAAAAQEWRLAVTPYRSLSAPADGLPPLAAEQPATSARACRPRPRRRVDELRVVDLSALWAGPLATSLLAALGASVVKIDPDCRPDGLRDHGKVYDHLNRRKEIVDLDLRVEQDRQHFETLLADADLVVDSFSRRVMPNLGYGPDQLRERFPNVATLSIVAFGSGSPEADWISYGPGVHAISGLGDVGPDARLTAAPNAYPDPLAGLLAFERAAEVTSFDGPTPHVEVSLAEAIAPLVKRAVEQALVR